MGRARSPNRDKAYEVYESNRGQIPLNDIADMLNEKTSNIYSWKNKDNWDRKLKGDVGAPKGNLNGLKNGMYCDPEKRLPSEFIKKWFPIGFQKAYEDSANTGISKLDKLGHSIDMLWARILVSQKITQVKNKRDMTKELKRTKFSPGKFGDGVEKEYELQLAWDKENSSLDTYSKAMERLTNMIDKYEKLLHANWDLATEEQKARIEKLKVEVSKASGNEWDIEDTSELEEEIYGD